MPRAKRYFQSARRDFRNLKWIIMAVTLGIYYITPWLRWDRGSHAPDQAVLLDMANRRFYFFFIEIWPQEFYFVAGLLVMAGVGLFLVTSVVGRAWCGYTCPQTVWTDLFLVVERFIEGDRNARMKLDQAPWTLHKLLAGCQTFDLAGDCRCHRWCVDFLFCRCADILAEACDVAGAFHRLCHRRRPDGHHICFWRHHAGTSLHLHVSVAAHPGCHAG